ncbi:uncharacterized protein [Amphiura filiformis]|uniref:uncharacterized protein n=1 Tax=Amphiura filiformis TaxID=82378 RepID=UPI003B210C9E
MSTIVDFEIHTDDPPGEDQASRMACNNPATTDGKPFRNHGNYYSAFILAFFLGSCGTAMALTLFAIPPEVELQSSKPYLNIVAQCFGSLYTLCLIILCLWFILRYKHLIHTGYIAIPVRRWKNAHVQLVLYTDENGVRNRAHHSHSSSFQIVAFGIGSILYLVSELVKVASEKHIDKIQIVQSTITLLCCLLFIIFLKNYHAVVLKNCKLFHYYIAVMLGAEVCIWVSVTMCPLWSLSGAKNATHNVSHHDHINFETGLEIVQSFLQPFFVEFLSISAACLLGLWNTMRHESKYQLEYEPNDGNNAPATTIGDDLDDGDHLEDSDTLLHNDEDSLSSTNSSVQQEPKTDKFEHRQTTIIIILSNFLAFLYVTSYAVDHFDLLSPVPIIKQKNTPLRLLWDIINSTVFGPLILLILVSLYKLNKNNINITRIKPFSSSDYLLLFTSSALFVYNIVRVIAQFGRLIHAGQNATTLEVIFQIVYWIGSIIHVWGQTQLILTAQYIFTSAYQKMDKFTKFTFIILLQLI